MRCKRCKKALTAVTVRCMVCDEYLCMDCYIEHVKGGSPGCTRYCNQEAKRKKLC